MSINGKVIHEKALIGSIVLGLCYSLSARQCDNHDIGKWGTVECDGEAGVSKNIAFAIPEAKKFCEKHSKHPSGIFYTNELDYCWFNMNTKIKK